MKTVIKPVPGYEGYFACNNGFIYSNKRAGIKRIHLKNHTGGYNQVELCVNGVKIYRYVHRMVALAFLGEPVGKMDVNHKDGNKKNNRLSNLEWCTRSENQIHAFSTGVRTDIGERKYNSVLSEYKVRIFRHLYDNKIADEKEMAKMFGVNQATLSDAVKRKTWRHI